MADEAVVQAEVEPAKTEPVVPEVQPPRTYTQEEVDRITAKVKKNERYRTRKEVEAYYQGRESVVPAKPAEPAKPADAAPTRDQFATYEDFLEAKTAHTARTAAREESAAREKADAERREQQTQKESAAKFQAKVREKFPDIDARLEEVGDMPMYRGVQNAIAESQFGPEILNELVSNPKEFDRLAKMSESSAVREIGKMEARYEAKPSSDTKETKEVKQPSKAPEPIKPISGKTATGDGEPSHDNPDAWRRWRDKQVAAKRSGGSPR